MKTYWWGGGTVPRIFNFGMRQRRVVTFTRRQLYPQGKRLRYPLNRKLDGFQSRSGHSGGEEKKVPVPAGN
jgi:hypothetical protein